MRSLFRPNYLRKKSILWAFAALLGPIATPVLADAEPTITRIDHTSLSGGRLQIDIYSSAALPAPRVFRTSAPDRIVLDFFGVRSQLKSSMIDVGRGAIENILIAQDQERSRMVINLISAVGFVSEAADNRLTLVVDPVISVSGDGAGTAGGQMGQTGQDSTRIGLIDFRRTPEGAGRVILEFDSEQALVDVHQHLGEIVLDISGGLLDDALVRRLDVIDFATPVQFIDAFATDSGARVVVMPRGEFEFASLQSGKRFTLDVSLKPVAGEGDQAIT